MIAALRERLAGRPRRRLELDPEHFRSASVLVPLLTDPDRLILTVRPINLRTHAGQIAFPGGKRDLEDKGEAECALREADEELGIKPAQVEVLGLLDDFATPTGYVVTPVVGLLTPPVTLVPSVREVAEVFEITLDALRAPGVWRELGMREFLGVSQMLSEYVVGERRIWGITARVIEQLLALLG